MEESNVQYGTITVKLFDENGDVKHEETVKNLITDAGDLYQATRIAAGVNSNGVSQPTLVTGMKLGTATTAAAKADAGLATYLTASNVTFDAGYPQVSNLGAGLGVNVVYRCTWAAGVATSATINEVAIVNDAATNADSTAANTISRGVFGTTINKAAGEALEVTWNHKQLGA
jgi:hypothetical protein